MFHNFDIINNFIIAPHIIIIEVIVNPITNINLYHYHITLVHSINCHMLYHMVDNATNNVPIGGLKIDNLAINNDITQKLIIGRSSDEYNSVV